MTAKYDDAISAYFREQYVSAELPKEKLVADAQRIALRYGANPHQKPAEAFVTEGALPFKGSYPFHRYDVAFHLMYIQCFAVLPVISICLMP